MTERELLLKIKRNVEIGSCDSIGIAIRLLMQRSDWDERLFEGLATFQEFQKKTLLYRKRAIKIRRMLLGELEALSQEVPEGGAGDHGEPQGHDDPHGHEERDETEKEKEEES